MVGVERAPAERGFGKIAGADDEAVALVGDVHQDLRTFAGLSVLEGDVVLAGRMLDVAQVLIDGFVDRNLAGGDAERLHQAHRIDARAGRRARARHRESDDALTVEAEAVEGFERDEQGERRIEAARDTDDDVLEARVADAAGEARGLNREDFLTVLVATVRVGRYERMLAVTATQLRCLAGRHAEGEADDARADGHGGAEEGAITTAFSREAVEVDLRDDQREIEAEALGFAEDDAVLSDEAVTAVDDVGARFAGAGGGVDVSGEAAGRLRLH